MNKLILLFSLCFFANAQAQNFEKTFTCTSIAMEDAKAAIELADGKILVGINNTLLCLAPNGDSLWTKTYPNLGYIEKIFKNNQGDLMVASNYGKMVFLKINETNGDTISTFKVPSQTSNSGYIIYDVAVLPDGDFVLAYTVGGSGNGGTLTRFTPGSTVRKWSNDYAGKNVSPKAIYVDDTTLVFGGYKGNPSTSWDFDLYLEKISINNVSIWNKSYLNFKSTYKDRLVGLQKNNNNQYLLAANMPFNNRACATILKVANNGDSLGLSQLVTYQGDTINHGYCYSLQRNGSNGFYAAGLINLTKKDPLDKLMGVGYMAIFKVSENGEITNSFAYNNIGIFQIATSTYDGSQAWGAGAFMCKDNSYLLFGNGNKLVPGTPGWIWQAQRKGYVVKNTQFTTGINTIEEETSFIVAYPNPFTNKLNLDSEYPILQFKVVNLQGQEIMSLEPNSNKISIDLFEQNPGVYLVQTETEYGIKHIKVVKNY